jgi:hypothetical protein
MFESGRWRLRGNEQFTVDVAVRAPASHDRDRLGVSDGEPEPARLTCLDGLTGSASTSTPVLGVVASLDGGMVRSEPGVAGGRRRAPTSLERRGRLRLVSVREPGA